MNGPLDGEAYDSNECELYRQNRFDLKMHAGLLIAPVQIRGFRRTGYIKSEAGRE